MKSNILDHYAKINRPFLHGGGKNATEQLISLLNIRGTEKILEVGFGTGATQVRLKSLFPTIELYGLELSSLMMDRAKKRLSFVGLPFKNLHLMDSANFIYPFDSGFFDIVLFESVLSISSIDEIKANLKEVSRVSKQNGRLAMSESIWIDGIAPNEILKINEYCKNHFGINLAQEDLPSIKAWQHLLTVENFEIQNKVEVIPTFGINNYGLKDFLSSCFSYLGKLLSFTNAETYMYKTAMKELNATIFRDKQFIVPQILILKSSKIP